MNKIDLAQQLISQGKVAEARELLRRHYAERTDRKKKSGCGGCRKRI
jgi:hypothetical protein